MQKKRSDSAPRPPASLVAAPHCVFVATSLSTLIILLMHSNVRRILKRGARKLENNKYLNENFSTQNQSGFPVQNQMKTKKKKKKKGKRSSLKLARFLVQNWVQAKNKDFRLLFVCSNLLPKLQKGGDMPQFCILFYANYTILATQRGKDGPMPPPP